jgi:hypothetical protein
MNTPATVVLTVLIRLAILEALTGVIKLGGLFDGCEAIKQFICVRLSPPEPRQ